MTVAQEALTSAAYALFALQQPLGLDELALGARAFPVAQTQTPTWFAAAASEESSLLETAPELLVMPDDEPVDVTGIDLIRVYAPELTPDPEPVEVIVEEKPAEPVEKPRTSTQIGLLKELSNLDD